MSSFWGIVVDQSLKDKDFIKHLNVVAKRQVGSWDLLLVSLSEHEMDGQIALLQQEMIDIKEGRWYAHFFRDNELIVVYQDRTFRMTVDPTSWTEAVQYGFNNGIPTEQLDFSPRTKIDTVTYFGLNNI